MNYAIEASFGSIVRRKRENLNLSQAELAARLRYPQSNISRLETGRRSPTLRELLALAQVLRTSVNDLLAELETDISGPKDAHSMLMEPSVPYRAVPVLQETMASEDAVLAQLAAYGIRFLGKSTRPAVFKLSLEDTVLAALRFTHDPRLFEALPSLVLQNAKNLDWNKLVYGALVLRLQNRLGMVVAATLQLRKYAVNVSKNVWKALGEIHHQLAEGRLDREEVLGPKPRTQEALEHLLRRTPPWLRAWHALGTVDMESLNRHLPR